MFPLCLLCADMINNAERLERMKQFNVNSLPTEIAPSNPDFQMGCEMLGYMQFELQQTHHLDMAELLHMAAWIMDTTGEEQAGFLTAYNQLESESVKNAIAGIFGAAQLLLSGIEDVDFRT